MAGLAKFSVRFLAACLLHMLVCHTTNSKNSGSLHQKKETERIGITKGRSKTWADTKNNANSDGFPSDDQLRPCRTIEKIFCYKEVQDRKWLCVELGGPPEAIFCGPSQLKPKFACLSTPVSFGFWETLLLVWTGAQPIACLLVRLQSRRECNRNTQKQKKYEEENGKWSQTNATYGEKRRPC